MAAALSALIVVAALTCGIVIKVSKGSVKGEWKSREESLSYTFQKDNVLSAKFDDCPLPVLETNYTGEIDGDYSINKQEKTLVITLNYYNKKLTQKYSYEIKNDMLALKNLDDGVTSVFYKQK